MADAKEITPTVFGWVIAYMLPGLFAIFTLGLFFRRVASQLVSFSDARSTIGLFLMVVLASVLVGMQIHALRWMVFEKIFFRGYKVDESLVGKLNQESVASSFRVIIDECYRYHQFYGAQVFIFPVFFYGLLRKMPLISHGELAILTLVAVVLEIALVWAACVGLRAYCTRANIVLGA